jgi:AcrR family transcriptional regulator
MHRAKMRRGLGRGHSRSDVRTPFRNFRVRRTAPVALAEGTFRFVDDESARRVPRQGRSKQTVASVFEAMLQLVERSDDDDPSVHEIAERAGVSVGSIYQYFPNKGALVRSLVGFYVERRITLLEREIEAAAKADDAKGAASRLVGSFLEFQTKRSRVERAIVRSFLRSGALEPVLEHDERLVTAIERFLAAHRATVRDANPRMAAFLVLNSLRAAAVVATLQHPAYLDEPEFRAELTTLVVRYLERG